MKAPCASCPTIHRGCRRQQPPPLPMVHARDVIAVIVILHVTIGVLLSVYICYTRRNIPPPDTTVSTDDTSSSSSIYITKVPTQVPPPPAPPAPPPQPSPPIDDSFNLPSRQSRDVNPPCQRSGAFNLPSHQNDPSGGFNLPPRPSTAFNLPRRTGGGASAQHKGTR